MAKFKFLGDPCTPLEKKGHYILHSVIVEADNLDAAYELALQQWPEGHKPWTGFSLESLVLDENDQ